MQAQQRVRRQHQHKSTNPKLFGRVSHLFVRGRQEMKQQQQQHHHHKLTITRFCCR
jgi:hypothetical protein